MDWIHRLIVGEKGEVDYTKTPTELLNGSINEKGERIVEAFDKLTKPDPSVDYAKGPAKDIVQALSQEIDVKPPAGQDYVSSLANYVLTGEADPSQEVLDAASEAWVRNYRLPFMSKEFTQWLYTGRQDPSKAEIQAAIKGGKVGLDCYTQCLEDVHKEAWGWIAGTAGAAGAAGGLSVGYLPKSIAKYLGSSMMRAVIKAQAAHGGFLKYTNLTQVLRSHLKGSMGRALASKAAEYSQLWHTDPAAFNRLVARSAVRGSIAALAIAETLVAAYCAKACTDDPCFKLGK